jgi:hypothetical protein
LLHECTLRAAIQENNALGGSNRIVLPAGAYVLRITGQNEDNALTGDLDLHGSLAIEGASVNKVTVDAAGLDRVFDVQPDARVQISGMTVQGGSYAGIRNRGALALGNCAVARNANAGDGGGIANTGSLALHYTTISENSANRFVSSPGNGGGVANTGELTTEKSAIYDNTSVGNGGGLWSSGQVELTNSTISNNRAEAGAGIYLSGGDATLNNVTISINLGNASGGIQNAGAELAMSNSILGSNLAQMSPSDCAGAIVSKGYNLIQSEEGCLISGDGTGDILGKNPVLGPLGLDGGQVPLHPLLATSPAIDAGNPAVPGSTACSCAATDQRDTTRPQSARCDIGAYERLAKPPALNFQVSAARRKDASTSRRVLAWTVDSDSDWNTNSDRRIALARWTTTGWHIEQPSALPAGADSPSVALDSGSEVRLVFLQRRKDADGVTDTGIGTQAAVYGARYTAQGIGYSWVVAPVLDTRGNIVRGESPLVATQNGHTVTVFRRFGDAGTTGALGQLAVSTDFGAPIYIATDMQEHWQPALALDSGTGDAIILSVARPAAVQSRGANADSPPCLTSATPALNSAASAVLSTTSDPVESFVVKNDADAALDSALIVSQQHPQPGATVDVSATVRNLGRLPLSGLKVTFYSGTPSAGVNLGVEQVTGTLQPGAFRSVAFSILVPHDTPIVSARVSGTEDVNPTNNDAVGDLSTLPPPRFLNVSALRGTRSALRLHWLAPQAPGVAGYRILRAVTSGGPYELVGQTTATTFDDLMLTPGQRYYYIVQAYDTAPFRGGQVAESPPSAESSGQLPSWRVFLPAISR